MRTASLIAALSLALCSGASAAETPMSAEAFERYATGKTLTYSAGGQEPYGAEEYLDNRRVRWSFLDGDCKDGFWYEEADQICFVYDDNPTPQCWSFYQRPGGIVALFENDPAATTLYELGQSEDPMLCYGPDVGV